MQNSTTTISGARRAKGPAVARGGDNSQREHRRCKPTMPQGLAIRDGNRLEPEAAPRRAGAGWEIFTT